MAANDNDRRRVNIRLALLLAAVALCIFVAFIWSTGVSGK